MMLRDFQVRFLTALRDPDAAGALSYDLAPGDLTRLTIYRQNMVGGALDALKSGYPVICRLVGERFFDAMGRRYLRAYPSRSANLHRFGDQLHAFLDTFEPAAELVYLSALARLEWAWHRAHFSAPCRAAELSGLRAVAPDDYRFLSFYPAASLALIDSQYAISRIWQVNQLDWDGPSDVESITPGECLVVWRMAAGLRMESVPEPAFALLRELASGRCLGELTDSSAGLLADYLAGFVSSGWLRPEVGPPTGRS